MARKGKYSVAEIRNYCLYIMYSNEHHIYIGITTQPDIRKSQHLRGDTESIKELLDKGFLFEFEILYSNLTEQEAIELEKALIKDYKKQYKVLNKCAGGQSGGPGRMGENSSQSKLSDAKVIEIRELYAYNNYSYKELSNKYNVSITTICNIIHGKRSPHLGGPISTNNLSRCHKNRKLSEEDVIKLRKKYSTTGKIIFKEEATQYNITGQHLSRILRGVDLRDLPGPILGRDYKW